MARILAVVGDLFFADRLRNGLTALGHDARVIDLSLDSVPTLAPGDVDLALVDLEAGEPALAAVRSARAAGAPVLAFGPHMDLALRDAGLTAGATQVVAKSKLTSSLPELVAHHLTKGS